MLKNRTKKQIIMLLSLLLVFIVGIGATVALLLTSTQEVENTFKEAHVTCAVAEDFDGTAKRNVCIENTSNIPAYIRAKIVVSWQDRDGNVYGDKTPVKDTDYTITFSENTGWTEHEGFYYYEEPVANGKSTPILIERCAPIAEKVPEGYYLCVEILGSAIQADGVSAGDLTGTKGKAPVEIAWGVTLNADGTISK